MTHSKSADSVRPALPQLVDDAEILLSNIGSFLKHVEWTDRASEETAGDLLQEIRDMQERIAAALTAQGAPAWQPMDIPLEALQDAVGLVASERNKWEHAHRKTYQHWVDVYTKLAGLLLAEQVRSDLRTLPAPPRVGRPTHEEK